MALAVIGYLTVWPWLRDRPANATADALIADLDAHGGQVEQREAAFPAVSGNPTKAELEELIGRLTSELGDIAGQTREFVKRTEELLPKTPAGKRDELRQALERHTTRIGQSFGKYKERGDHLRARAAALKGGS
jgi:hypothetical protein